MNHQQHSAPDIPMIVEVLAVGMSCYWVRIVMATRPIGHRNGEHGFIAHFQVVGATNLDRVVAAIRTLGRADAMTLPEASVPPATISREKLCVPPSPSR